MSKVYILGGAQTDFERNWKKEGKGMVALLKEAMADGLENSGLSFDDVKSLNLENRVACFVGNFIAEKYVNPAKTFKIGKKNYVKKFKKAEQYWKNSKKISGKLVVKAKKGWKITKIRKAGYNITPKKIKNGKKVTLTGKNPQSVVVTFKNKKTKQKIELVFVVIKAAG